MRTLLVIGIGPGDPEQLTAQAVRALNRVDVFFVPDKGTVATRDLTRRREEICRRHITRPDYRIVEIPDPPRDRDADGYEPAVAEWTRRRAERYRDLLTEALPDGGVGGILAWGDPSLYDATLRVLEHVTALGVELAIEVVPGITAPQALAARHCIALHRVGRPVHITTGRRLSSGWPEGADDVVVMLDGQCTFARLPAKEAACLDIYWGANLGTEHEAVVSGPLTEVGTAIEAARAKVRAHAGWVMDTYLLRRREST